MSGNIKKGFIMSILVCLGAILVLVSCSGFDTKYVTVEVENRTSETLYFVMTREMLKDGQNISFKNTDCIKQSGGEFVYDMLFKDGISVELIQGAYRKCYFYIYVLDKGHGGRSLKNFTTLNVSQNAKVVLLENGSVKRIDCDFPE